MKPSWNDAPEWARYLAMDSDGAWYWYDNKPTVHPGDFVWYCPSGNHEHVAPLVDWKNSIESRPEPEASVWSPSCTR